MVLVKEFGSISIDRRVIKADPLNIVDLSGGCVCCGMSLELMASLKFALDTLKADIILIEGTGLAIPQEIARQALTPVFEGRLEFGGIITVVDAGSLLSEESPILWKQLEAAIVIVVNKIDLLDADSLEEDPHTKYLAAAVSTIGAAVETKCRRLKKQRDFLRSLFLDAAGVALLEALGDRSYEVLSAQAQSRGLFTGCRFGPGYGDLPMSTQGLLFELARGEQIGVSLNQHMVMKPGKSLSFFVRFTSDETSARNVYKCQACPVKKCSFRMACGPASQSGKALDTNASSDLPS
jgi:hypothetical protein